MAIFGPENRVFPKTCRNTLQISKKVSKCPPPPPFPLAVHPQNAISWPKNTLLRRRRRQNPEFGAHFGPFWGPPPGWGANPGLFGAFSDLAGSAYPSRSFEPKKESFSLILCGITAKLILSESEYPSDTSKTWERGPQWPQLRKLRSSQRWLHSHIICSGHITYRYRWLTKTHYCVLKLHLSPGSSLSRLQECKLVAPLLLMTALVMRSHPCVPQKPWETHHLLPIVTNQWCVDTLPVVVWVRCTWLSLVGTLWCLRDTATLYYDRPAVAKDI